MNQICCKLILGDVGGHGVGGRGGGGGVGVVCQPTIQHIAHYCCANVFCMASSVKYHSEKKKENNIFSIVSSIC